VEELPPREQEGLAQLLERQLVLPVEVAQEM
jgi:hypothetical protein